MEKNTVCLRKGAWSKEEDILLTKCIEKYGEGKWHLVPPRAGLNRCRKSCRLRWLNYLSPNIKRGSFAADEIDLIVRLHKLLGNRWSLIAGRIPGRTANDVKNFWNTYTEKKRPSPPAKITKSNIIKPRPRVSSSCKIPIIAPENEDHQQHSNNINYNMQSLDDKGDACVSWWSTLLRISENVNGAPFLFPVDEGPQSHNQPNNLANVDGVWEFLSMDNNYSSNECFPPGLL